MLKIANCLRPSLLGDVICSLPFLIYLEKKYSGIGLYRNNSYKSVYIDKKCQQIVPFLLNHPLIDKIYISELADRVSQKDEEFFKGFDLVFEPFVPLYDEGWFNKIDLTEGIFRINFLRGKGYINPEEWNLLTEAEKKPRLDQYFDVERRPKTIAIWPNPGYNNNDVEAAKRGPSKAWWLDLIVDLKAMGYTVCQYGFPSSEPFHGFTENRLNLSLFDGIKESLGCDLCIGTDSGSSRILGAYGARQIVLYATYRPGHTTNFTCFVPVNYKNNLISFMGKPIIDNIDKELVLKAVEQLNT
jgi:ADP-heptose:LPS heptosyltransferase